MRLKRAGAIAAAVATVAAIWYVEAPPRSEREYGERAVLTAELLRSQVESARLTVRAVREQRTTHALAVVLLRDTDRDATATERDFLAWNPPAGAARGVRADVATLASDVTSALGELRIAAEDGRWKRLEAFARPLPDLRERLDALARRAEA